MNEINESFLAEVLSAVRSDPVVGSGTTSCVAEAMTDKEVEASIKEMHQGMTLRWKLCVKAYVNKFRDIDKRWKSREGEQAF